MCDGGLGSVGVGTRVLVVVYSVASDLLFAEVSGPSLGRFCTFGVTWGGGLNLDLRIYDLVLDFLQER